MPKKTFKEIRENILKAIKSKKRLTPTQISLLIGADYRTVNRHLIWLRGLGKVKSKSEGRKTYFYLKDN